MQNLGMTTISCETQNKSTLPQSYFAKSSQFDPSPRQTNIEAVKNIEFKNGGGGGGGATAIFMVNNKSSSFLVTMMITMKLHKYERNVIETSGLSSILQETNLMTHLRKMISVEGQRRSGAHPDRRRRWRFGIRQHYRRRFATWTWSYSNR